MARKAFAELSELELVELTEEQIQDYIDLACAQQGVGFLPPRPVDPGKQAIADDMVVQAIGHGAIHVRTAEAAARVLTLFAELAQEGELVTLEYLSGPSFRKMVKATADIPNASPTPCLSPTLAGAMKTKIEEHERAVKQYEKDSELYHKARGARDFIETEVRDRIAESFRTKMRREERRRHFERYLELADGNRATAAKFLKNTYPDALELLPELEDEMPADESLPVAGPF